MIQNKINPQAMPVTARREGWCQVATVRNEATRQTIASRLIQKAVGLAPGCLPPDRSGDLIPFGLSSGPPTGLDKGRNQRINRD